MDEVTARLADEICGLSADGTAVITVQRWEFSPTRSMVVTTRNGRKAASHVHTADAAREAMDRARTALAPTSLTGEAARTRLATLVGWKQGHCTRHDCGGELAIGDHRCVECGMTTRQVAAGRTSGARGRPTILLRSAARPHLDDVS